MTAKDVTSVRVDRETLKKAQEAGLNISALFSEFLEKVMKEKKCPTCGQKLKK